MPSIRKFTRSIHLPVRLTKPKKFRDSLKRDEMETSAIGDMAFLLLIFFIVTSSFMMKMGIFLSLPSDSGSAVKVEESQLFEITPRPEGFAIGNDKEVVSEKEALQMLREKQGDVETVIYVIYMGPKVKYERLIDALSIARQADVKKISVKDQSDDVPKDAEG